MMAEQKCRRCKASLKDAKVVPQSNYTLVYCPRCRTINVRED